MAQCCRVKLRFAKKREAWVGMGGRFLQRLAYIALLILIAASARNAARAEGVPALANPAPAAAAVLR